MIAERKAANSPPDKRWLIAAAVLALIVYFAITASDGLHAYFTQDDGGNILNMHKYWSHSMADMLKSAVRVVTGTYRPLGGAYYFALYRLAGFNPVPFRAVCLLLMLVNVLLAFALMRRLSGSLEAAMLGAILITNHPAVLELIYSSGTIYEILCFLFYCLTLRCYFVWRQEDQAAGKTTLSWRRMAMILVLTGCALDSKEMAMTLPAALLLIELIYFPPKSWSWRAIGRFWIRQGRTALVTAALVIPTIAAKVLTKNPLSDDTRYHSHSVSATLEALRAYQHFWLYGLLSPLQFSTLKLMLLWTVMAGAAILLRSRPMKFGLCFAVAALLPVCLIAPRGGYMSYIPLLGWALYWGALFERLCHYLFSGIPQAKGLRFATFVAFAVLIVNQNAESLAPSAGWWRQHQTETRRLIDRLRQVHPHLPQGASLLLVDDPQEPGFELLFLAQLAYFDRTLELDRIKMLPAPPSGVELTHYDFVLAGGWELHDVRGVSDMRPPVQVLVRQAASADQGTYVIEIPEFAGREVDIAARTVSGKDSGRAITQQHYTLDSSGMAAWRGPLDSQRAVPAVRWVRPEGGDWMSAAVSELLLIG